MKKNLKNLGLTVALFSGICSSQALAVDLQTLEKKAVPNTDKLKPLVEKNLDDFKASPQLKKAEKMQPQLKKIVDAKAQESNEKYRDMILEDPKIQEALKDFGEEDLLDKDKTAELAKRSQMETYHLVISSSIPEATLQAYTATAEELLKEKNIEIIFLMRGAVGGLKRIKPTLTFWGKIASKKDPQNLNQRPDLRPVQMQINPELADQVSHVPALFKEELTGCVIYGDYPLEEMLDKLISKQYCNENFGQTYNFNEQNALEELKARVASIDQEKLKNSVQERARKKYTLAPGEDLLPSATETVERQVAYSAEITFNIPHPKEPDTYLYTQGSNFKPLDLRSYGVYIGNHTNKEGLVMSKTRINISLDQDLADFAKVFAAENRTSVADMMTQYLLTLKRKIEGKDTEMILSEPAFQVAMEEAQAKLQDGTAEWYSYDDVFGG